jgi:hypothetical protein
VRGERGANTWLTNRLAALYQKQLHVPLASQRQTPHSQAQAGLT